MKAFSRKGKKDAVARAGEGRSTLVGPVAAPTRKPKKVLLIGISLLIVLVLAGAGAYLVMSRSSKKADPQTQAKSAEQKAYEERVQQQSTKAPNDPATQVDTTKGTSKVYAQPPAEAKQAAPKASTATQGAQ